MSFIAAVQTDCVEGNIKENTQIIIDFLHQMENDDVSLAVFPEMCLYGYENLEEIPRKYTQKDILSSLENIALVCAEVHTEAVVGAPFIADNYVENAQYFITNKGNIFHIYSKIHLINFEKNKFVSGNRLKTCQSTLGRLGFLICWDTAFPEAARAYGKANAQLIAVSSAWEKPYLNQWHSLVCSRSVENCMPVVAANRVGKNSLSHFVGHSVITDCSGNVLVEGDGITPCCVKARVEDVFRLDREFGVPLNEVKERYEVGSC